MSVERTRRIVRNGKAGASVRVRPAPVRLQRARNDDVSVARRLPGEAKAALAGRAYARLRADILHGDFRPGEVLSENLLAGRLAVSRTPVREAIQRLVREGLVDVLPQRGSYVALLSLQRIREALFIREAIESTALRCLVASGPDHEALGGLQVCIDRQAAAHRTKAHGAVFEAEEAFHRGLLEACAMQGVWALIDQARATRERVRAIASAAAPASGSALADHRAILRAIRNGRLDIALRRLAADLKRDLRLAEQVAARHPDYFEAA